MRRNLRLCGFGSPVCQTYLIFGLFGSAQFLFPPPHPCKILSSLLKICDLQGAPTILGFKLRSKGAIKFSIFLGIFQYSDFLKLHSNGP